MGGFFLGGFSYVGGLGSVIYELHHIYHAGICPREIRIALIRNMLFAPGCCVAVGDLSVPGTT